MKKLRFAHNECRKVVQKGAELDIEYALGCRIFEKGSPSKAAAACINCNNEIFFYLALPTPKIFRY